MKRVQLLYFLVALVQLLVFHIHIIFLEGGRELFLEWARSRAREMISARLCAADAQRRALRGRFSGTRSECVLGR